MALDQQSEVFLLRRFRNLEPQYTHHRTGLVLSRLEVGLHYLKAPTCIAPFMQATPTDVRFQNVWNGIGSACELPPDAPSPGHAGPPAHPRLNR